MFRTVRETPAPTEEEEVLNTSKKNLHAIRLDNEGGFEVCQISQSTCTN